MAALLRHAAARKVGGSMVQRAEAAVAEGRRGLGPRLLHTEKRVAEGKKGLKDLSDQASPTSGGFDWREFPFARVTRGVASIGHNVVKVALLAAVVSEIDFRWLFGLDRP